MLKKLFEMDKNISNVVQVERKISALSHHFSFCSLFPLFFNTVRDLDSFRNLEKAYGGKETQRQNERERETE